MSDVLITGARVVTPDAVVDADVLIRGGKVRLVKPGGVRPAEVGEASRSSKPSASPRAAGRAETVDGRGHLLLPGFVDIHTHGYEGFDFTLGVYDVATDSFDAAPQRTLEALDHYVRTMPRLGLTAAYLATLAAPPTVLRQRLDLLAEFLKGPPPGVRLRGAFLEGTFISDRMLGAMNSEFVHPPDVRLFDQLNASGAVKLALVAPEAGPKALTLIRHLARRGIVAGAGHTDATAEELRAARRAGLKYMVHFLNGPTGSSFKPFHGGGAVEGALADDRLCVELIADGYHVDPRYARAVIHRKGFDRVVAVSDSMFAAGAAPPSGGKRFESFQMNGVFGKVSPDGKYLQVAHNPRQLFGSCLDMPTAWGNLVSWLTRPMEGVWARRHEAAPLEEALVAASRMTATNAARLTGLDRRLGLGSIADGRAADLVLARLAGRAGAWRLNISRTWIAGREAYRRPGR